MLCPKAATASCSLSIKVLKPLWRLLRRTATLLLYNACNPPTYASFRHANTLTDALFVLYLTACIKESIYSLSQVLIASVSDRAMQLCRS